MIDRRQLIKSMAAIPAAIAFVSVPVIAAPIAAPGPIVDPFIAQLRHDIEYIIHTNAGFEFNDAITRNLVRNQVGLYLHKRQAQREFYQWLIKCDETNNPPEVIDSNDLRVELWYKRALVWDTIYMSFSVLEQMERVNTRIMSSDPDADPYAHLRQYDRVWGDTI